MNKQIKFSEKEKIIIVNALNDIREYTTETDNLCAKVNDWIEADNPNK